MPRVSVIIPVHDAEGTIHGAVTSVLDQTWRDLELIVVDDGSTDQTVSCLSPIRDPRLRVCSQRTAGVATARNRGMKEATGEFLAFLDADDWWMPEKLSAQVAALDADPESGVAYSWTRFVDADGRERYRQAPVAFAGNVYRHIVVSNFTCSGSNILVRRRAADAVGGFDPTFPFSEDWEYCVRLAARWRFAVVRRHDVAYRQWSGSQSARLASDPDGWEREALLLIARVFSNTPADFYALKTMREAQVYLHMAHRILDLASGPQQARRAGVRVWRAVHRDPALGITPTTWRVLVRWLLQSAGWPSPAGRLTRRTSESRRV